MEVQKNILEIVREALLEDESFTLGIIENINKMGAERNIMIDNGTVSYSTENDELEFNNTFSDPKNEYPLSSKWQNPDNGFIFEVLEHLEDKIMLWNGTVDMGVTYDMDKMSKLVAYE